MNFKNSLYALAIAGACSVSMTVSAVYGQQTFSNISGATVNGTITSLISGGSPSSLGSAVLFNSSTTFSIYDVSFVLGRSWGGAISDLTISIYSVSGGVPTGSALASVTGLTAYADTNPNRRVTTLSGSTIAPITALTLSSGTDYALLLVSGTSGVGWAADFSLLAPSASGGSPLSYVGLTGNYNGNWNTRSYNPYVSIGTSSASPVPEANGSVAGLGLAVAGLYQLGRRRQKTVTQ